MITAIPQVLDGIRYRSRTEARWAYFFDLAGIEFEYEPEGFDLDGTWYVPDFWLPQAKVFFEVKGPDFNDAERSKAAALAVESWYPVAVAVGNPSDDRCITVFASYEYFWRAYIVPEFKGDGAWIAEFSDGGGRSIPLHRGLVNCSAAGVTHPALAVARKLQFAAPEVVADNDFRSVGVMARNVMEGIKRRRMAE